MATEDAFVLEAGKPEVEIGHDYAEAGDHARSFEGIYTVKAGLPQRLEINFTTPVVYRLADRIEEAGEDEEDDIRESGAGDLQLLGKWNFIGERGFRPAAALVGLVNFPSGDTERGLGEPKAGYEVLGVLSKSAGPVLLHLNTGWSFVNDAPDSVILRAGADWAIHPKFSVVAEWDGSFDFEPEEGEISGVLGGFIWRVHERVALDLGARAGTTSEDENFRLTAGATIGF
jgi:hypothetical protein